MKPLQNLNSVKSQYQLSILLHKLHTRPKMSETNPTYLTQRQPTDAKNVDTNAESAYESVDNKAPNDASFPGPGGNATARAPQKPHSSKMLNKLDPRYDSDIIEAAEKEKRGS